MRASPVFSRAAGFESVDHQLQHSKTFFLPCVSPPEGGPTGATFPAAETLLFATGPQKCFVSRLTTPGTDRDTCFLDWHRRPRERVPVARRSLLAVSSREKTALHVVDKRSTVMSCEKKVGPPGGGVTRNRAEDGSTGGRWGETFLSCGRSPSS